MRLCVEYITNVCALMYAVEECMSLSIVNGYSV